MDYMTHDSLNCYFFNQVINTFTGNSNFLNEIILDTINYY